MTSFFSFYFSVPRFKQRLAICVTRYGDTVSVLDVAKVADSLLCVLSPEEGIDDQGDYTLKCLLAQGLPAVNFVVQVKTMISIELCAHFYTFNLFSH